MQAEHTAAAIAEAAPKRPTAEQVFTQRFDCGSPRSTEYKAGFLAALRYRLGGVRMPRLPYPMGTAQADAWFAGVDEGHFRFQCIEAKEREALAARESA